MQWDNVFASRVASMKRSTIRDFLKLTQEPGMISFAGGLPAAELLPTDEITDSVARIIKRFGSNALQYGATEGIPELRDWIAERFSAENFTVGRDNVIVVSGAQQAIDMAGRVFLDSGDRVVVENPTYLAALLAWRPLGVEFVGLHSGSDTTDPAQLRTILRQKPKLAYVVPNFQNPQGTTLSLASRQRLRDLTEENGVPLIEDDPYRELRFDGTDLPSIFSMQGDPAAGNVLYVGTVSKVIAPGLRVGWIVAPTVVIDRLLLAKQAMDLHTSTLNQYLVLEMLRLPTYQRRLAKLRECYRERRDAMLAALDVYFPSEATWSRPTGGMFVFARLPEPFNTADLLGAAIEQHVIFVPGADFHVDGTGHNTMRLNFTRHPPEMIYEGIRRLGQAMKVVMKRN